jgi:hypothetical protein
MSTTPVVLPVAWFDGDDDITHWPCATNHATGVELRTPDNALIARWECAAGSDGRQRWDALASDVMSESERTAAGRAVSAEDALARGMAWYAAHSSN